MSEPTEVPDGWPRTAEDRLLERYLEEVSGELLLEVPVGTRAEGRARRIDGVFIPGGPKRVHAQGSLSLGEIRDRLHGREVRLIEAKLRLNRAVIGQVVAGKQLLEEDYGPSAVTLVVVAERGHADLERVSEQTGIEVRLYPETAAERSRRSTPASDGRVDLRRPPDPARQAAFMSGWEDAVNGRLYGSIRERKTHMNMGNLFGWIYGDQPQAFRESTWQRYAEQVRSELEGS